MDTEQASNSSYLWAKCFIIILCWGGWWRWALVSPDGVAPSRIVDVSASVNFPLHHKVQKFSSGTSSPRWSRKKGRKTVVVVGTQLNPQIGKSAS